MEEKENITEKELIDEVNKTNDIETIEEIKDNDEEPKDIEVSDSKPEKKKKCFNKSEFIQFVKFSAFSLSAGIIQISSFEIMYDWIGWKQWWATYLISIVLSVIWNFTFNRKFTFKSASNIPVAMSFAMLFYVFFIPVSVFGGEALKNIGWNGTLVTVVMMLLNFVLEYIWDKFIVFNDKLMNKIIKTKRIDK